MTMTKIKSGGTKCRTTCQSPLGLETDAATRETCGDFLGHCRPSHCALPALTRGACARAPAPRPGALARAGTSAREAQGRFLTTEEWRQCPQSFLGSRLNARRRVRASQDSGPSLVSQQPTSTALGSSGQWVGWRAVA